MTSLHKDIELVTDAATTWDAVRDFGGVHERFAAGFVTATEADGDERVVTFVTGAVARERLIGIDEDRRRFAYAVIESPLGLTHHNASFEVIDHGSAGCRLVWDVDLLPSESAPLMEAMMDAGAAAIAATLAR